MPDEPKIEDVQKENERLKRENQSLRDREKSRGTETEVLRAKLGEVQAARGPRPGTEIRFTKAGEKASRPGKVLSDGYTERVPCPGGFKLHAHIEYGEHETSRMGADGRRLEHTFECDAAYDPLGRPGTWCLPDDEQDRLEAEKRNRIQAP